MAAKTRPERPSTPSPVVLVDEPPVAASLSWEGGWWATITPRQYGAEMGFLKPGQEFLWPALPGVGIGDVFVIVTSSPDRRLRAWAQVIETPQPSTGGDWQVRLRFGATLERPIPLRTLKDDPGLATWQALVRVSPGRLEAVPPALWTPLRAHVGPSAIAAGDVRATVPTTPRLAEAGPWTGLDRGGTFRELAKRFFLPQGYARVELLPARDEAGIDVVAYLARHRWTKVVAQLDVTGEAVDVAAAEDVRRGMARHGAAQGLLIALGPVSDEARALAAAHQIEVWDDQGLQAAWQASQSRLGVRAG